MTAAPTTPEQARHTANNLDFDVHLSGVPGMLLSLAKQIETLTAERDALVELGNCANRKPVKALVEKIEQSALPSELNEYERLFAWRAAWQALANKFESNRLQSRQERIERKAVICNNKIHALMRAFDVRVGNTCNQV